MSRDGCQLKPVDIRRRVNRCRNVTNLGRDNEGSWVAPFRVRSEVERGRQARGTGGVVDEEVVTEDDRVFGSYGVRCSLDGVAWVLLGERLDLIKEAGGVEQGRYSTNRPGDM